MEGGAGGDEKVRQMLRTAELARSRGTPSRPPIVPGSRLSFTSGGGSVNGDAHSSFSGSVMGTPLTGRFASDAITPGNESMNLSGLLNHSILGAAAHHVGYIPSPVVGVDASINADGPWNAVDDLSFGELSLTELRQRTLRAASEATDQLDQTVVRFNRDYVIRDTGASGTCLTLAMEEAMEAEQSADGEAPRMKMTRVYNLGVQGRGVGDTLDALTFVPVDTTGDIGLRYGAVISIRSPSAKDRFLGIREGSRLGFWRHMVGQSEKWQILRGMPPLQYPGLATGGPSIPGHTLEDVKGRGKYVRLGDPILLMTYKSENLLTIHDGEDLEPRLIPRDRVGHTGVVWQLEAFGTVPLPIWNQTRPYLNGTYLTLPPTIRTPAPEVEARVFPHSTPTLSQTHIVDAPILRDLPFEEQEYALLRDVLMVLFGGEGRYVRLAQNKATGALPSTAQGSLHNLAEAKLVIDTELVDRSLANQVATLFPFCVALFRVRAFIAQQERYEFGRVSHALCASIKELLHDFQVQLFHLEGQLNQGKLTLNKTIYLLQPSRTTILTLEKLTLSCRDLIGGELLNRLYAVYLEQGDRYSKALMEELLRRSAAPFLAMLENWIYLGRLSDPYHEFMVSVDTRIDRTALVQDFNSQYWESRFTLNATHIPSFLGKKAATKALTAGKYLTVVNECLNSAQDGGLPTAAMILPECVELRLQMGDSVGEGPSLSQAIETAYQFSSAALLRIMTHDTPRMTAAQGGDTGVRSRLRRTITTQGEEDMDVDDDGSQTISPSMTFGSLQARGPLASTISSAVRYFLLLEQGDFFAHFLDLADIELKKEVKDISLPRLQHLLQTAIAGSSLANDRHKGGLRCELATHTLIQHLALIQSAGEVGQNRAYDALVQASPGLKGVEAFMFDYEVEWPASLVLSRRAIAKYQLLARLLHLEKHAERALLNAWIVHQGSRQAMGRSSRGALGPSLALMQRMLHFMQALAYYLGLEVLRPRAAQMLDEIHNAQDMDAVLEAHERFLDSSLRDCLLASQPLLKAVTKLLTTCLLFADHTTKMMGECIAKADASWPTEARKQRTAGPRGTAASGEDQGAARMLQRAHITRTRRAALSAAVLAEAEVDSYRRIIDKFTTTFDSQLREFLDGLWHAGPRQQAQLGSLASRLDYNGYYASHFSGPGV